MSQALLSFLTTVFHHLTTNYNNIYPSRDSAMSTTEQYSVGTGLIKYFVHLLVNVSGAVSTVRIFLVRTTKLWSFSFWRVKKIRT